MRLATLIAAALLAPLGAAPAEARDQINQRETVRVDPQRSYILFRTRERADLLFIREPTTEERTEHASRREQALERAQARYERALASYRRDVEHCRSDSATAICRTRPPERPEEVTAETFGYPPLELANIVGVSRSPLFGRSEGTSRDDTEYSYLIAVKPGTYILYGQISATDNGPVGVCLCMGTISFEAPAGRIVDLGEVRYPRSGAGGAAEQRRLPSHVVVPPTGETPLPDRLAGLPLVRAELRASGKLPNYFAVEIDRHPPIDGVLAYDRDRVIDLKAQASPVASGGN